ncbi:MAG: NAD-dependent epimerase/dehydratase family protein [Chitinophagia bacterium]
MNKKVLITGASGMIGGIILDLCLQDDRISEVVSLVRKPSSVKHKKLTELLVEDFMRYEDFQPVFENIDIVFYCVGVYTGSVPRDAFRKITVDYPLALATVLYKHSPGLRFCLLSGQGADRKEQSKLMFAKDKGTIENLLSKIGFDSFYSFRPGYIYPVSPRKEPNFSYRLFRGLYPVLKLMGKGFSIKSTELARAMFMVGLEGASKEVLENGDIVDVIRT